MSVLVQEFKNKILSIDNHVSLSKNYILSIKRIRLIKVLFIFIIFLPFLSIMMWLNFNVLSIVILALYIYIAWKLKTIINNHLIRLMEELNIRESLLYLICTNKLYTTYTNCKGIQKVRSATLSYLNENDSIVVRSHITGDSWSNKMREIEDNLSAVLGLELTDKKDFPTHTDYLFNKNKVERLMLSSNPKQLNSNIEINLGCSLIYNPSKVPHILISGGTGSGKSMTISFLILEFLKQQSKVYICDPKNSDLGSLSYYLSDEYVAHTPNNIARIVRTVVEEMNKRYEHMKSKFVYGSNFIDHNYKPIWLIFDEMGSFQASGIDKTSNATISEVMNGLKQIILLGRQAGVFILVSAQQMRAETLNTDLRDNLGLRIALGSNSSEGLRMTLGNFAKDLKPVDEIGAGYLYMQGSGKETAQYYETPYFTKDFDFIKELQKYI